MSAIDLKNFAIIGAAGYVAPRHMAAIKAIGGRIVAAVDPSDSVGALDSFNKDCEFFTEFERFDRHCELLKRMGSPITHVSVCSPNYLHDAHCRWAMRYGANVICEKPLCINYRNIEALESMEKETGKHVKVMLQLRYHPEVFMLKTKIGKGIGGGRHKVEINYATPRGNWYFNSWKGNIEKSGGLATNIGIHLFDLMAWLFGPMRGVRVDYNFHNVTAGHLVLDRADVQWRLSVMSDEEPKRLFVVDGEPFELSCNFSDLHTTVYQDIMVGGGYGPSDVVEGIRITEAIRNGTGLEDRSGLQAA